MNTRLIRSFRRNLHSHRMEVSRRYPNLIVKRLKVSNNPSKNGMAVTRSQKWSKRQRRSTVVCLKSTSNFRTNQAVSIPKDQSISTRFSRPNATIKVRATNLLNSSKASRSRSNTWRSSWTQASKRKSRKASLRLERSLATRSAHLTRKCRCTWVICVCKITTRSSANFSLKLLRLFLVSHRLFIWTRDKFFMMKLTTHSSCM